LIGACFTAESPVLRRLEAVYCHCPVRVNAAQFMEPGSGFTLSLAQMIKSARVQRTGGEPWALFPLNAALFPPLPPVAGLCRACQPRVRLTLGCPVPPCARSTDCSRPATWVCCPASARLHTQL